MKRIIFFVLLISGTCYGQTTYYIRADSTRLEKVGANNELILLNSTKAVKGVLTNYGNGRTRFIGSRISNDTLFVGMDTLIIPGGGSIPTWQQVLTAGSTLTGNNSVSSSGYNWSHGGILQYLIGAGSGSSKSSSIFADSNFIELNTAYNALSSHGSGLRVYADSIKLFPHSGRLNIDSLRSSTDSTTRKPMTWNPATGAWEYLTYWPGGGGSSGGGIGSFQDSIANVVSFGADPTGANGSALAFMNAIATGRTVYVPKGSYKINGIDSALVLLAGQTIFGDGYGSELITTTNGATTTLATAMNFIICSNGNNTVRNLKFTGNGKTTYAFPWTTQNGVWVYSDNNTITGCSFLNLRGTAVLGVHPSLSTNVNNIFTNSKVVSSTVGFFSYVGSEYWVIANNQIESCDYGTNEWGANNNYSNCIFYTNSINGSFQGNGGNSDHTYVNGCIFNHGVSGNLNIDNIVNSLTFTGGGSWSSGSAVDESVGVSFSNFQWGTSANLTVTASSTNKATFLTNCFKATSSPPTFTESGTGKIVQAGTFNSGITSTDFTKNVNVADTLFNPGNKYSVAPTVVMAGYDTVSKAYVHQAIPTGGGGSPGGSNTQLQYNNSSSFGGVSGATSDGTNIWIPTLYGSSSADATITISGNNAGASNTATNDNILLKTGNTPTTAVVIKNNQQVIFTPSSTVPQNGVVIVGPTQGTKLVQFGEYQGATTYGQMTFGNVTAGNTNYILSGDGADNLFNATNKLYFAIGGASKVTINSSGDLTVNNCAGTGSRNVVADASGVYSAPVSDRSVKENIKDVGSTIGRIMKLRPVNFEYIKGWKNYGTGIQIGFIAQDIQKVLPNSVFTTPSTGKMGYNEQDIIPLLVKAVQEQQKMIEELQKEILKLKHK